MKDKKYLNIAMLGQKSILFREGGIEVVVEELTARMVEQGHKATSITVDAITLDIYRQITLSLSRAEVAENSGYV